MCLSGILDEHQAVARRNLSQRVHVGRLARDVNGQDSAGSWRDQRLNTRGIDIPAAGEDVRKPRDGPYQKAGAGRGDKGIGRGNDLVAPIDAGGAEGYLESGAAVGAGHPKACLLIFRKLLFQGVHLGTGRRPPVA